MGIITVRPFKLNDLEKLDVKFTKSLSKLLHLETGETNTHWFVYQVNQKLKDTCDFCHKKKCDIKRIHTNFKRGAGFLELEGASFQCDTCTLIDKLKGEEDE